MRLPVEQSRHRGTAAASSTQYARCACCAAPDCVDAHWTHTAAPRNAPSATLRHFFYPSSAASSAASAWQPCPCILSSPFSRNATSCPRIVYEKWRRETKYSKARNNSGTRFPRISFRPFRKSAVPRHSAGLCAARLPLAPKGWAGRALEGTRRAAIGCRDRWSETARDGLPACNAACCRAAARLRLGAPPRHRTAAPPSEIQPRHRHRRPVPGTTRRSRAAGRAPALQRSSRQ